MAIDFQLARISTSEGDLDDAAVFTTLGQALGRELQGAKCIFLNEVTTAKATGYLLSKWTK
jgi:hypothetical protein